MGYRSVASGRLHVSPITLLLELARLSKLVTPPEIVKTDRFFFFFFPTRARNQFLSPKQLNPRAIPTIPSSSRRDEERQLFNLVRAVDSTRK